MMPVHHAHANSRSAVGLETLDLVHAPAGRPCAHALGLRVMTTGGGHCHRLDRSGEYASDGMGDRRYWAGARAGTSLAHVRGLPSGNHLPGALCISGSAGRGREMCPCRSELAARV